MTAPTVIDLFDPARHLAEHGIAEALQADPTIETAARLLIAVADTVKALKVAEDELHAFLCDTLPGGGCIVDGVGYVTRKPGTKRAKWDHDELVRRVVALARDERLVNADTGEYEPVEDAVVRVLRECAGFSYWRVTALQPRGIDVDEFCETTYGPPRAVIE